jgi:hypothetical protein
VSDKKLDVSESERCIVVCGTSVFTWSEQVEKGDDDHVSYSLRGCGPTGCICRGQELVNDGQWYWIDTVGWRVFPGVRTELALDAEIDLAQLVVAWIRGPHAGNFWPTERRTSSTVRDRTLLPRGAILPSRYRAPKTCNMGTASVTVDKSGWIPTEWQKVSQIVQCESAALARLDMTPARIVSLTRQMSVRKSWTAVHGIAAMILAVDKRNYNA